MRATNRPPGIDADGAAASRLPLRLVIVGPASERARLRDSLRELAVHVVGEASTMADARLSAGDADAYLVTARERRRADADFGAVERLTPREVQVLELMAEGLPNKGIARRLGISDQTVKFHVAAIAAKLGAANRTDAVRRAVRRGLLAL